MSNFFSPFPRISYLFGEETDAVAFENIALYADTVDQVKNSITEYQNYYILPDERPDQVSQKLYGTPNFHWTFFLMNDALRERGWPLSDGAAFEKAKKDYKYRVLTTKTKLTDRFKVNQTVTGLGSGATGKIIHRNLDLGQLFIDNVVGTFTAGESIQSTKSDGTLETISLHSTELQYNAAHHYENADKEVVDIDPSVGPGAQLTEVTFLDELIRQNNEMKQIRVIREDMVDQVSQVFRQAIAS